MYISFYQPPHPFDEEGELKESNTTQIWLGSSMCHKSGYYVCDYDEWITTKDDRLNEFIEFYEIQDNIDGLDWLIKYKERRLSSAARWTHRKLTRAVAALGNPHTSYKMKL